MRNLFWLYWHIFINSEFFNKKTNNFSILPLSGYALLLLLALSVGYSIGFVSESLEITGKTQNSKLFFVFSSISIWFLVPVFIKAVSPSSMLIRISTKKLAYLPINFYKIYLVEILVGLIERLYILPIGVLVGFCIFTGVLQLSLMSFIFASFMLLLNIFILHIFSEIILLIINVINFNLKTFLFFAIILVFLSYYSFNSIQIISFIKITPLGWFLSWLLFFFNYNNFDLLKIIFQTSLILALEFSFYMIFKWFTIIYLSSFQEKRTNNLTKVKKTRVSFSLYLPASIQCYVEKELNLIRLSKRTRIAIFIEFLIVIYYLFQYSQGSIVSKDIFLFVFNTTFLVMMPWDYYLSNSWGFDKNGFGLYLFMPIIPKNIIFAKNISYFLIKTPITIIYLLLTCLLFSSSNYLILLSILYLISLIVSTITSNFTAIINVEPVDINESAFSKSRTTKFSSFGLFSLLLQFVFPSLLLLFLYLFQDSNITYYIFFIAIIVTIYIYKITLNRVESMFEKEKESMYKELIYS